MLLQRKKLTFVVSLLVLLTLYFALKPSVHRDTTFNCKLHPKYEEFIYKNLEYFSTGITQSMIDKTKEFRTKIVIKITDGAMSYSYAK